MKINILEKYKEKIIKYSYLFLIGVTLQWSLFFVIIFMLKNHYYSAHWQKILLIMILSILLLIPG